jgi:hypothetical protein
MTFPLPPIGAAALGGLALQALQNVRPGEFLRELWNVREPDAAPVAPTLADTPTSPLDLTQAVPAFADRLAMQLMAAGVDLTRPIVLKDDGQGAVIVDGDHPDRATIEGLLAADSQLRADFRALSAAASAQRDRLSDWLTPQRGEFRYRLDGRTGAIDFE